MPIKREIWHRLASRDDLPSLPCPQCTTGKLKLAKDGLDLVEPKYSKVHRDTPEWEVDHVDERWSARLRCDEKKCGEIAHMIGDSEVVEAEVELPDGDVTWCLRDMLRIRAVFPSPPMFQVPENLPKRIDIELRLAFRMYWTDASACVARLRTAVEAMLDEQNVPKERLSKKQKLLRMSLVQRIESFAKGDVHKDQLQGLRNIGNLGTHGTRNVTDEDLFDAIDVLEFVLRGVYETQAIDKKAKKLANKKPSS